MIKRLIALCATLCALSAHAGTGHFLFGSVVGGVIGYELAKPPAPVVVVPPPVLYAAPPVAPGQHAWCPATGQWFPVVQYCQSPWIVQ
jgi:surfactin synthase thioesterase subunit